MVKSNQIINTKDKKSDYSEMVSTIFKLNPDAIVLTTLSDSEIIDCNQEYLNQIGYSRDEVIGRTSIELNLLSSDEREAYVNTIHKNNSVSNYEVKVRRKDGSNIYVLYSARFITVNGKDMILNIGHDITERKKREQENKLFLKLLQEEKEKLSALISNIPDEVWFAEKNKKFTLANPSAVKEFNLLTGNVDVEKIAENLEVYRSDGTPRPVDEAPPLRALKGEFVRNFEEIVRTPYDDELRYRQVNASPVRDANNHIVGSVSVVRDITELKIAENQIKYQANLLSNVNDAVVGYDSSHRITYWNKAAEHIFGYTEAEAIGKLSHKFLAPKYDMGERDEILEQLKNYGSSKDSITLTDKNGNEIIVEANSTKITDHGNNSGYVVVYRDITERKNYEKRILRQAKLMDLSFDAIIVAQYDGGIVFWNHGAEELYGYSKNEAIGLPIHKLLRTISPIYWYKIEEKLRQGGIWEGELRHQTKDGANITVSSRIQIIEDNGVEMLLETNRDITWRKSVENHNKKLLEEERQLTEELTATNEELHATTEELRTSNEEQNEIQIELRELVNKLKISNKELEQFAYVASHDLQEPLRMVSSFTQLLERRYKDRLDDDADDYIEFIVEGAKRMKDLIDDLLTFSRLNKETIKFEVVLMDVALDHVLNNLKAYIKENNAEITFDSLPTIECDRVQIQQLLQNLLTNAIKFHGDEPPRIHISAHESGNELLFSITDNGIGIDPRHQEQIFDIFKRLHTRQDYEGTGIGLSICKRIVERHAGQLWVESELGKGSTFYFTIPRKNGDYKTYF